MKITVTKKQEVKEEIEIDLPAYFKDDLGLNFYKVEESRVTQVCHNLCLINQSELFIQFDIQKAVVQQPTTKEEFDITMNLFLSNLNRPQV